MTTPKAANIDAAVEQARKLLQDLPEVVEIRKGWKFREGWITDEPAVVVVLREKLPEASLHAAGRNPFSSVAYSRPPTPGKPATRQPDSIAHRRNRRVERTGRGVRTRAGGGGSGGAAGKAASASAWASVAIVF